MSENDAARDGSQAAIGAVSAAAEDEARAGPGVLSADVVSDADDSAAQGGPILAIGDASWAIDQADAVAFLSRLGTGSIDLVVTDPPYESLEKHRAVGTTTRLSHSKSSSNDWFTVFPNVRFRELFDQVHRVLTKNAHFYLFCDQETAFVAKPIGEAAGFKFWKPIIWDKCLAPETLVWTTEGVRPVGDLAPGDRVVTPDGRDVAVLATRRTHAPVVRLSLSDRTNLVCSAEHRLIDAHGAEVEAGSLTPGDGLKVAPVRQHAAAHLPSLDVVSVERGAPMELVDLAIDDPRQLYVLANGVVSHNCKIGMGYHYRSRYEMILFFEKGKRRLNDLGIADVIRENRIHRGYPTEKPVRVNQILIEQSTSPGQLVVDPFMGTASAGLAALSTGRRFFGSDVSDKAIAIATERLTATGAKRMVVPEAGSDENREGQLPLGID
jgi:DNA modification methylase